MTDNGDYDGFVTADAYASTDEPPSGIRPQIKHNGQMIRDLKKLPGISKGICDNLPDGLKCTHCKRRMACPGVPLDFVKEYVECMYYDKKRPEYQIFCPYDIEGKIEGWGKEKFRERVPTNMQRIERDPIEDVKSHLEYMKTKHKYEIGDVLGITDNECRSLTRKGIYGPVDLCISEREHIANICGIPETRASELIISAQKLLDVDGMIAGLSADNASKLKFMRTGI